MSDRIRAVVTADIIGSRSLPDRAGAQRAIDAAVARVESDLPTAQQPFTPTVGDELQAVYPTLEAALAAVLLLRLALPDGVDCRFGIGLGAVGVIPSAAGDVAEGPGWWAARAAIETLHAKQVRALPNVRTWIGAADDADDDTRRLVRTANAYAWSRDELVSAMSERTRRLVYGRCLGATQRALAETEGITQSAVSQALTAAGAAAVVAGFTQLSG
ncbi:SatD family protein [Microbacterium sp. GXF7504]